MPIRSAAHFRPRLAMALLAAIALAGCSTGEVRVLDSLPSPVFPEPAWDFYVASPATAPDEPAWSARDVEAGWRNFDAAERPWRWIVIHHSGTVGGDARNFDQFHRETRGWDELGYHFVIGNGTNSPDGRIEPGSRWVKQKHGAHCKTPSHQFNDYGVGVCLVGNFERTRPTPAQWAAAVRLCAFLCREYSIPPDHILGHRDGQAAEGPVTTECPGRNMDLAALRQAVAEALQNR